MSETGDSTSGRPLRPKGFRGFIPNPAPLALAWVGLRPSRESGQGRLQGWCTIHSACADCGFSRPRVSDFLALILALPAKHKLFDILFYYDLTFPALFERWGRSLK
jgi:hypothetical protein